ncbi:MAG: flagellar biosynthesis protein FlhF [Burkholderiaceae bacterium]
MTPRKFIARSAREAMDQVREVIGPDAVILANRKVEGGVEITALDESELARWEAASAQAETAAGEAKARPEARVAPAQEAMSTVSFERFVNERQRRVREQRVLTAQAQDVPPALSEAVGQGSSDEGVHADPTRVPEPGFSVQAPSATTRQRVPAGMPVTAPQPAPSAPAQPDMAQVVAELRQMRSFISQQFGALSWVDGVRRTPAQARILREMLAACFSPRLARALVGSLPGDSSDEQADRWLADALVRNLSVACFEDSQLEQGGVFALVGPTGVGKTTSAAKIAAQCALRYGAHRVGLIGIDTYRVAAQDQLRRYGEIIGIDVHTVRDGRALLDTISRMTDKHLVLIDTVGLGQRDPRVDRMLDALNTNAVRRLIVVSAAAQAEAIDETLSAYRAEQAAGALLTKVDEACRLGGAIDALIRYRVPLMAVGNGQRVPEDWHRPDAAALVEQALRVPDTRHEGLSDLDLSLLMQRVELGRPSEHHAHQGAVHV